jgi:hypothetical protein
VRDYSDAAILPAGVWHIVIRSTDPPPASGAGSVSRVRVRLTVQG